MVPDLFIRLVVISLSWWMASNSIAKTSHQRRRSSGIATWTTWIFFTMYVMHISVVINGYDVCFYLHADTNTLRNDSTLCSIVNVMISTFEATRDQRVNES